MSYLSRLLRNLFISGGLLVIVTSCANVSPNNRLIEASYVENLSHIDLALKDGAEINSTDNYLHETPFFIAVDKGHVRAAARLVDYGADVNIPSKSGMPALLVALHDDNCALVRLILENGGDPNYETKKWPLPLEVAVQHKAGVCAEYLLTAGADPNQVYNTRLGLTPFYASVMGKYYDEEIFTLLLENGGRCTAMDNVDKSSPIVFAAIVENNHYVLERLAKLCDMNVPNKDNITYLHLAISNGDSTSRRLLLQNNANPNVRDNEGRLPIEWATEKDREGIAKMIAEYKND